MGAFFPLFEAPTDNTDDFLGRTNCSICQQASDVCFELGIGCALMLPCPACGNENGLDASDRSARQCRHCEAIIPFPKYSERRLAACYSCLRAGKAAITKDTELGMISWNQAFEGMTHGCPGLKNRDFELVPTESDWIRARLPREMMFELLRTPSYSTIQGDQWLFCCKHPMVFLGQRSREDFATHASDGNGEALFRSIVEDIVPGLWEGELHDETGVYVFRCPKCARMRAHWDLA